MPFYSFYLLVFFVPFASNQNDIFFLRKGNTCFDRFPSICNCNHFFPCGNRNPFFHFFYNFFRVFISWVIRGENYFIAILTGHFCHFRPFSFITVTPTTNYSNYFSISLPKIFYGSKYI